MNAEPSTKKTRSPRTGAVATLPSLLRGDGSGASSCGARFRILLAAAAALAALTVAAPSAQAAFGLHGFDVRFSGPGGEAQLQAGAHPFAFETSFEVNVNPKTGLPEAPVKDLRISQVPGFAGIPAAVPRCKTVDFLVAPDTSINGAPECADGTAVGLTEVTFGQITNEGPSTETQSAPVYNLEPPPGSAAKLGFYISTVPITIDIGVSEKPPYNVVATVSGVSQVLEFFGSKFTIWGVPASEEHDALRGHCLASSGASLGSCPAGASETPFLISPRACNGPLETGWGVDSWVEPATDKASGSVLTHDELGEPHGFSGCAKLGLAASIAAQPTTKAAQSPSGLDFSLDVQDEGLTNPRPGAVAGSDIERAEVTLPRGISINPSQAEGLAVCSEHQLEGETAFSAPGDGCPQASKIGTIEVETPLLPEQLLKGSLYVATPYENEAADSLIAFYIVIKNPELGISVIQPAKVTSDPVTGQLVATTEEMPQLPFSHFRLHFKEGARSPLVSPPACGEYQAEAKLTPYSGGEPVTTTSAFQIVSGPDNSPCPSGGLPPFHPGLEAGTINNAAGRYSPFNVKLTRTDSEQEITHFSIKLPPGVAGKLAGIPFCSDAAIAAATARTGPHGGQEELNAPSCPAASYVGRTLAGAGVGPSLAYAPGKIYLAGPYHGKPLSLVAITAGVVGPFDIGTVVVRLAIDVNPETGEVFLDSTGSDPIPHIIKGIPVHLRDIRAYTDRPEFTFNPTSCEPTSTSATVLGSGLDFTSEADDNPFVSTSRFQAADCAALPFKPKLTLALKGSHKRAGDPALRAHLAMNGFGEAGLAYAQVALPASEFLDNAHIGTVCTRVQFKEGAIEGEKCPANSVIGHAKAVTPILSEALEGPIYLRSNPERELPDIAAALQGSEIHVVAVGHTDSAPGGGLRNTFEVIPDAPISSVDIDLFGGHKGLIKNSQDICTSKPRATVRFTGHNGKQANSKVAIKASGCKAHKKARRHHRRTAKLAGAR